MKLDLMEYLFYLAFAPMQTSRLSWLSSSIPVDPCLGDFEDRAILNALLYQTAIIHKIAKKEEVFGSGCAHILILIMKYVLFKKNVHHKDLHYNLSSVLFSFVLSQSIP